MAERKSVVILLLVVWIEFMAVMLAARVELASAAGLIATAADSSFEHLVWPFESFVVGFEWAAVSSIE